MKNLAISNDEEEDLLVDGAATNISVNADLCLVGGFIIDQLVNFNIIKSQIATIWKPKKGINIKDIVGKRLGDFIGSFLQHDESNSGTTWRNYMRIRVKIGMTQPLKWWKNIKIGNWVLTRSDFKYEKLHLFCFICGKLDHTESLCDELYKSTDGEILKVWGSWLRAIDCRCIPLQGEHWLRADGFGESVGDDKQKEVKLGELNDYGIDKPVHMEKSGFSTVKSEEDVDDSSLELRKHKRPTFLCGNPHTLATSLTTTTTAGLDTTSTIVDTTTTVVDTDYFIEAGPGYEACQN
ncbi:hypothetical protein ACS0TY_008323 [Phlomoides rotata]